MTDNPSCSFKRIYSEANYISPAFEESTSKSSQGSEHTQVAKMQ